MAEPAFQLGGRTPLGIVKISPVATHVYDLAGNQDPGANPTRGSASTQVPVGATYALIVVDTSTADVRWRDDGTNPAAATGVYLAAGGALGYDGDLLKFRFIPVSGSPVVHVAFYS